MSSLGRFGYLILFLLSLSVVLGGFQKGGECSSESVRCSDGTCVPSSRRCDGREDCPEGEDEDPIACRRIKSKRLCAGDEIRCALSGFCIPDGWQCDGEQDCPSTPDGPDLTDENPLECKRQVVCPEGKYECIDKRGCIDVVDYCDGLADCPDGSDEGIWCADSSSCNQIHCEIGCLITPYGPQCVCHAGYTVRNGSCVDKNECADEGACDQTCENTIGSFICNCTQGYHLFNNECIAVGHPAAVVIMFPSEIRGVFLNGSEIDDVPFENEVLIDSEMVVKNGTICVLKENGTTSTLGRHIECLHVNQPNQTWTLPNSPQFPVEDVVRMAYDWVSDNWYFVDRVKGVIVACRRNMTMCVSVLDTQLALPRGLALDPLNGTMFFTVSARTRSAVERANLDGSARTRIVTHKVVRPEAVTLDLVLKHVYWVDTYMDLIDRVDYDGRNRLIIKRMETIVDLRSIAVFQNELILTANNQVYRVNKFDRRVRTVVKTFNNSHPLSAFIYQDQMQPQHSHPCATNTNCRGLCVTLYSSLGGKSVPVAQCLCPHKNATAPGCLVPRVNTAVVVSAIPSKLHIMSLRTNSTNFITSLINFHKPLHIEADPSRGLLFVADVYENKLVIRQLSMKTLQVDSSLNLPDSILPTISLDPLGMNVYHISSHTSSKMQLTGVQSYLTVTSLIAPYSSRRLLKVDRVASLRFDKNTKWLYWSLQRMGPIMRAWPDGSHVAVAMPPSSNKLYDATDFAVDSNMLYFASAMSIMRFNMNNSKIDEVSITGSQPYNILVQDGFLYYVVSEGFHRMPLGSNAKTEPQLLVRRDLFAKTDLTYLPYVSSNNQLSGPCVRNNGGCSDICVSTPAGVSCMCNDTMVSDGPRCVSPPISVGACISDQFRCATNTCIDTERVCDGFADCSDASDEVSCDLRQCMEGDFPCDPSMTYCIPSKWLCDGEKDCPNGADEFESNCQTTSCGPDEFRCNSSGRCIPMSFLCDGQKDCMDSEDENNCSNKSSLCLPDQLECDGLCLEKSKICDGIPHCIDGLDEDDCINPECIGDDCLTITENNCTAGSGGPNCPYVLICEPNEFMCANNLECIRQQFICDGRKDCFDGSDEIKCPSCSGGNCTSKFKPIPSTPVCDAPGRLCDNNTVCVQVEDLCDDRRNCKDGSDEGGFCDRQLCVLGHSCSHFCHSAPEGHVCYCPAGLHLRPNSSQCIDPCEAWGVCSQTCHVKHNRVKCGCLSGYRLEPDLFSCKSNDSTTPLMIFSNRNELRGVDLRMMNFTAKVLTFGWKNTIALDFYFGKQSVIFWTDVIEDKIYRGSLIDGALAKIEVVVQSGLTTAEGLAVDWIGGNLYWVESNLDQIEVAKLNGSFRRTLIAGQMESPRAIALDPRVGLLFWTDWDATSPRIERCSMAGGHRRLVVHIEQVTDGAWPNGLTLDYVSKRVYWIDARSDSIHTTLYDGSEHRQVMHGHETLSHPFAIALFDNYVYWTDWRTNSVSRANKWNGTQLQVIQRSITQPFDIKIMHPSRQPRDMDAPNPCEKNNGNCSHLCLIDIDNGFQCSCPRVMRLGEDKRSCVAGNERVLIFSRSNEIRGVDLEMPYFHTIPTISSPQVIAPSALDFDALHGRIYWADPQRHHVTSASLQGGPSDTLIDTGNVHPSAIGVDWLSGNLFVGSCEASGCHISVCNLHGEYITVVITARNSTHLTSLAVDSNGSRLFWAGGATDGKAFIKMSFMDGSSSRTIVNLRDSPLLALPQSLQFDEFSQRLFWISGDNKVIQTIPSPFDAEDVTTYNKLGGHPFALVPYNGRLYYADHTNHAIYVFNITEGENVNATMFRNNTGDILSMRIYDPELQKRRMESNPIIYIGPCNRNRTVCQHICLPMSLTDHRCVCATGYNVDPKDATKCIGISELIIYSLNWEVKGLTLNEDDRSMQALGPLSRVAMATHLTCLASQDMLVWADSDHGRVTSIHRDGTKRSHILDRPDTIVSAGDLIAGVAVDWVAGNVYWTDPKVNVIEVARLDGSKRYVVVPDGHGRMGAIVVDPISGTMFWAFSGALTGVMTARLDGSDRRPLIIVQTTTSEINYDVVDIAIDTVNKAVYWCIPNLKQIGRINYDGSNRTIVLNTTLEHPNALVVHDDYLYWTDTVYLHGSMRKAPLHDLTNQTVILKDMGDLVKDIDIFSPKREVGSNPCKTHPCAGLCLFNGTHPVCTCAHGRVDSDGVSCVDYDEFVMYSRITQVDSVHMTDSQNLNAPFPPIEHREFMINAIGLSYDYRRSRLFYSDIQRGSINAVFFNGTNHTVLVERQGSVEGIAYDNFDNVLYWTCNNYATISRMYLNRSRDLAFAADNGTAIETVVKLFRDDKPRGIVVNPCHSQIFWTNWNTHSPSIQRSFINGFALESIVTTNIKMPNAITLDFQTMKLYWGDARLDKIERCDINGQNRVILTGINPMHPFDLAVFGDYLFWTDWVLHAVMRGNKYTGDEVQTLRKDVPRPMGIVAVHREEYKCTGHCDHFNGGCEDICALNEFGGVVCSCLSGRVVDARNPTRCIVVSEYTNTTNSTLFQCSFGSYIPFDLTCDGVNHCEDKSDEVESYCAERSCIEGYHLCPSGRCISLKSVCDTINDCGDMSDEFNCACDTKTHFLCQDGKCIMRSFLCDFDPDCSDASDEMNCPARNCDETARNLFPGAEIVQFVNCNHTTACIHPRWICDDQDDCWDGSDELNCPEVQSISKCRDNQFTCKDGRCISQTWACDHDADCEDGSDEQNCPTSCKPDQFKCNSSECLPMTWRCDLTPDCADGSDESFAECNRTVCSTNDFRCNSSGRCIPMTWVCDKTDDCSDKTDEVGCLQLSCIDDDFQCENGQCIAGRLYCDGHDDCGDGSDEPGSCEQQPICSSEEFQCEVGTCIPLLRVCDGAVDCPDNSDENIANCNNSKHVCNSSTHFLCTNGLCVSDSKTCDGNNDCGDFSDEIHCNIDECMLGSPCSAPQVCVDKKILYECRCPEGLRTNGSQCTDINECDSKDTCSHFCWNTYGSFHCFCPKNYTLRSDLRSCKANTTIEPLLLYSNRYYIRSLAYRTGVTNILAYNFTNVVGLDYDWQEQCLYWSDFNNDESKIQRMCHNGSRETLHSQSLEQPDGLAVDWVGRNLYWCDKGLDTIQISKLDGRYRKVLIDEGLSEPRAITLNPFEGAMYWTDWGEKPYIGKASMNGSNVRIIVNESLAWPNALTISYESKEMFYADAKEDYIAVTDLEGRNRRVIISRKLDPHAPLHHIFAMTVFEEYIFLTDWELKGIVRCHRLGKKDCEVLTTLIHRPLDIQVYHPYRQIQPDRNPCENNGNCSALCLLTGNNEHVCACPENFILGPDGKSCIAKCGGGRFVCASTYKCIPFWWQCDTQDDCGDKSDEPEHCSNFTCHPGQYQCGIKCLHPIQICDGIVDCDNMGDESNCDNYECLGMTFKCSGNGTQRDRCLPHTKRCDGVVNCPNGEDEQGCQQTQCKLNENADNKLYFCKNNSTCIPSVFLCDEAPDCPDASDEGDFCLTRKCPPHYIKCVSGQCIPEGWRCDGDLDCPNGEDEANCSDPQQHTCQPSYFKCDNFKCIPGRWKCDYANDCGDNSDEVGCVMRNCSESEFRCGNGKCIAGNLVCDGRFHCLDQLDEYQCNVSCNSNEFECVHPKQCIHREWKCDGDPDCLDGSDEFNCSSACHPNQFTCHNMQCIDKTWVCDGENDCGDGSDEEASECSKVNCPNWRYRCKDLKCIPDSSLCDGFADCSDAADERKEVCERERRCGADEVQCRISGECVAANFACDGVENCVDGSDELDCDRNALNICQTARNCSTSRKCLVGLCSQRCVEKKNHFSCQCGPGYTLVLASSKPGKKKNDTDSATAGRPVQDGYMCLAIGEEPKVVFAADANIHIMGFYSPREIKVIDTGAAVKTHSIDFHHTEDGTTLYFVDHLQKKILSLVLPHAEWMTAKVKRSVDDADNIVENNDEELIWEERRHRRDLEPIRLSTSLEDPKALAVDWLTERLYVIDVHDRRGRRAIANIVVMTLDGRKKTTVIEGITDPWDLALDPENGLMAFSYRHTHNTFIETSTLDGSLRTRLVHKDLVWPSGLAFDSPSGRLYFTDGKRRVIESIGINGEKRMIVARLDRNGPMPFKLDVFESSIVVSFYQSDRVVRLNKLDHTSNSNKSQGQRVFVRVTDVLVMQSAKQMGGPSNPCSNSPCHESALCVMGPHVAGVPDGKCLCPDGLFVNRNASSNVSQTVCSMAPERCTLACKFGTCQVTASGPKCVCEPMFTGELCHKYICSDYCFNGGRCSVVPHTGFMKCHCKEGFSGARCEQPVVCGKPCINGGECKVSGHDSPAKCICKPGFTGSRCENCIKSPCQNGGICSNTIGKEECLCQRGYRGNQCEISVCEGYCAAGTCDIVDGTPHCRCPPSRTGSKCDRDACQGYCAAGAGCVMDGLQRRCVCPPHRTGPRCERLMKCGDDFCYNGGSCDYSGPKPQCRCVNQWGGQFCNKHACTSDFCDNGGTCHLDEIGIPHCLCNDGYFGINCENEQPGVARKENASEEGLGVTAGILIAVCIFLFILVSIAAAYFVTARIRRGNAFGHVRMSENVEMNNPMYLRGEELEDTDEMTGTNTSDRNPTNFANPVYETMYNAGDEKKNLLSAVVEEPLPLDNDSVEC